MALTAGSLGGEPNNLCLVYFPFNQQGMASGTVSIVVQLRVITRIHIVESFPGSIDEGLHGSGGSGGAFEIMSWKIFAHV